MCGDGFATLIYGDVSERPKVPASKAGVARATEGSNPSVSADQDPRKSLDFRGSSRVAVRLLPQPALTTVRLDFTEAGRGAVDSVLAFLCGHAARTSPASSCASTAGSRLPSRQDDPVARVTSGS